VALPQLITPPASGLTPAVPFTPIGAPPPVDLYRVDSRATRALRMPRSLGLGYAIPTFGGYAIGPPSPEPPYTPTPGVLRLAVTPTSAQVFVDGTYVGTVDDVIAQGGLALPPGMHHVEIRASGYQPLTFDVQIEPGGSVSYRGTLDPVRPPVVMRPPSAAAASRLYVIPNCYLGNIPPRADRLPSGCDIKRVRVVGE